MVESLMKAKYNLYIWMAKIVWEEEFKGTYH